MVSWPGFHPRTFRITSKGSNHYAANSNNSSTLSTVLPNSTGWLQRYDICHLLPTAPRRRGDFVGVCRARRHPCFPRYWPRGGTVAGPGALLSGRITRVRTHLQLPGREAIGLQALLAPVGHIRHCGPTTVWYRLHCHVNRKNTWTPEAKETVVAIASWRYLSFKSW